MLKLTLISNLIYILVFILNFYSYVFAVKERLDRPFPERNKSNERPLHANEITPNLPGLSVRGKKIEKHLENRVRKGELEPEHVGEARVRKMWFKKGSAEHQRNARHLNELNFKNEIRKESQTIAGRIRLKMQGVKTLMKENAEEKNKFRQKLRDIAHDSTIHQKYHTIGDKDARYINKPIWKESRTIGYQTNSDSKGSSFGYRSRSPSPNSSFEIISRPKRYPPPPTKSSSSSSSLPSLSSSSFDSVSNSGVGSTATSKQKSV